jgi:hypothetical protein
MKIQGQGNETRYDGLDAKIEAARNGAPGMGLFLKYKRWCFKCSQDKPSAGSRQVRPGMYKCYDCIVAK